MYNTDFVVRYNDIENELIQRILLRPQKKVESSVVEPKKDEIVEKEIVKKKGRKSTKKTVVKEEPVAICQPCTNTEEDKEEEEEYEYTMADVKLICEKLYRDELLSVFGVDTVSDKKMDLGITTVIEKMIVNSTFRVTLEEIKTDLVDINALTGTPTEVENMIRNLEYLIFVTLFNQQIFYIAHKCICQLFTVGSIDPDNIAHLKQRLISFFNR